jgi:hypothetical protein
MTIATPERTVLSVVVLAALLLLPAAARAQDADELAKQTQNPVASLISVPLQGNWDFGIGDNDETATLLNIQPVIPFGVSKGTNVILRVIMPLTSQPGTGDDRNNGMGDIVASAFFSPSKTGKIIWGVGPVVLLPTATSNALGSEKFGIGPTVVVLTQPGKWTLGALFNQIWSTSGAKDRKDVNSTFLQPFANYNLGGGLAAGVSMEATGNWEADEVWTAPLLFSVSKVTLLGKRPVNLAVAAGPMVASPAGSASWRFRLVATFLYPR